MQVMLIERRNYFPALSLVLYLLFVLCFTVILRPIGIHSAQFELFWSYRRWFAGDWALGKEIIGNMLMFVPIGYLLSVIIKKRKANVLMIFIFALLLSAGIELLQFRLMRGLCEYDDIVSNSIGALFGYGIYCGAYRCFTNRGVAYFVPSICIAFTIIGIIYIISGSDGNEDNSTFRTFCFQVEKATCIENELSISGVAFQYEHEDSEPTIDLMNDKAEIITLQIEYGMQTGSVDDYFGCEYNYSNVGFVATGRIDPSREYEILINFDWPLYISTGTFITGSEVHFVRDDTSVPNAGDEDLSLIIQNGTLLVSRPDFHCWVYQYEGSLYWVVDQDFIFEDDGSTYIQYQLWTTQPERLPQNRIESGWDWDNIGGYFEDFEIDGDFGGYRVMKRELPTEYSITSIETGYHRNGKWIWREFFRPIYEFAIDEIK